MSPESSVPWLDSAVARITRGPVGFPEAGEWPLRATAGEIRAARPMDEERVNARLILVVDAHVEDDPWVNACLLSNDVEVASDKDVRVDPDDTGTSFASLVETDIVGPLFMAQLGPRVGQVDPSLLEDIEASVYGEWRATLAGRRGLPISDREEARWRIKEGEVASMHALAHACLEHFLKAGTTRQTDVVIDPAFFAEAGQPSMPTILKVLSGIEDQDYGRVAVPTNTELASRISDWSSSLGPDEVRALEAVWQGCLRAETQWIDSESPQPTWTYPWNSVGSEVLASHLARRALSGQRAVRVLTPREYWDEPPQGAVIGLDVSGVGRVQVKPELVGATS